jgi:hypothetical protein
MERETLQTVCIFCISVLILLKLALKRSMRRRYGIPDHDQRPFNVAYAAARLAQEDRKKQDRIRTLSNLNQPNPVGQVSTRTGALFHLRRTFQF